MQIFCFSKDVIISWQLAFEGEDSYYYLAVIDENTIVQIFLAVDDAYEADSLTDGLVPTNLVTIDGTRFYVDPEDMPFASYQPSEDVVDLVVTIQENAVDDDVYPPELIAKPQLGHKSIIRNVAQLKQALQTLDDELPVGFDLEKRQPLAMWMYRGQDGQGWLVFEPEPESEV